MGPWFAPRPTGPLLHPNLGGADTKSEGRSAIFVLAWKQHATCVPLSHRSKDSRPMPFVITVAQQKGGTGKTTMAAHIAAALATTHKVALLDIDPQHSLARWHALRPASVPALPFSDVAGWRLA